MRHFKKAILVSLVFIIIAAVISATSISVYFNDVSDRKIRSELAGELDYLIIGASHGLRAFVPSIIDDNLNCSSYNLSGALMTFKGREAILNEELQRNHVKNVIFEISYNALTRPLNEIEGDLHVVPRLNSAKGRVAYFLSNIDVFHWDLPYSYYFTNGTFSLLKKILRPSAQDTQDSNKGYAPLNATDLTLNKSEIQEKYNSNTNETTINKENIVVLEKMIDSCRKAGANVIFVVTPVSDSCIWESSNWDVFYSNLKELSAEYNVKLYDFNLLKARYQLFNDKISFYDNYHLSNDGAKLFSQSYCNIVKMSDKQAIDSLFYSSYSEMKEDSPYNQ